MEIDLMNFSIFFCWSELFFDPRHFFFLGFHGNGHKLRLIPKSKLITNLLNVEVLGFTVKSRFSKLGLSGLFNIYFLLCNSVLNTSNTQYNCWWLDSNPGSLILKVTTLPTLTPPFYKIKTATRPLFRSIKIKYFIFCPVWSDLAIFALWATIQSLWKQLFYPNHPHC